MKKTQLITIGLLALSLAACKHKKRKHPVYNRAQNVNIYVGDGSGTFYPGYYGYPIMYNRGYYLGGGGRVMSSSGMAYRSRSGGGMRYSSGGRSSGFSRGGFGSVGGGHGIGS